MKRLMLALRLAIALAILVENVALAQWAGPDVEAAHWPILTRQSSGPVDLLDRGRLACWTWYFDKVRPAAIVDAGWTLRHGARIYPYQRVQTVADSEDMAASLVPRPVRDGQWSRKCIDVPADVVGQPFRLTGFVEYRTRWTGRFWTVRQPTSEVDAP